MNVNDLIHNMMGTFQWFGMLTLSLTIFRLKPAAWWRQNVILAITLQAATLTVKITPLTPYLPIIQVTLIALALFLFYRIRFTYACIIAVTGGIMVFVSLLAINYLLSLTLHREFAEIMLQNIGLPLYLTSATLLLMWTFFLSWTLKRLRYGFSFVTTSYRQSKPDMRPFGVPLTMFLAVNVMLPPYQADTYTPVLVIGVCLCLFMLLLASLRTEYKDDAAGQFGPNTGD